MEKEKYSQEISMNNEGMDLKEIFSVLKRYYKSLIAITILGMLLAFIYAYFATNIYQSETLMKLAENKKKTMNADFMAIALGGTGGSLKDEIDILRTRHLARKALENLNIGTRYFTKKNLKSYELYKDSPFVVTYEYLSEHAMEVPIRIIPSKGDQYRLIIEPTMKGKVINSVRSFVAPLPAEEQPIVYDKLHSFGEKIETPWFIITLQQVYEFENDEYYFTMLPNESMTDFIDENLMVSLSSKQGSIVVLDFQDNVPLRAKEILDALSSAYINENLEIKSKSAAGKLNFIDMQLEAINKTLKSSAKNLESYKVRNIVIDLSSKAQLTSEKMSQLETQLYEVNMRIDVMENILNYIETHKDIKGINIDSTFLDSNLQGSAIQNIILQIQKVTALRSDLLTEFKRRHRNIIKVDRQLISLRNSLEEAIVSSLYTFKKRKQALNDIIKENKEKMQILPEQERRLARLTRNFMVNEKIYSYLLETRAEIAIVESSTVSGMRIIESAVVAKKPIKPKRVLILLVGILLGFILGIVQAKLRSYLDNTIKRMEEIEKLTHIPIYGTIPFLHSKKNLQPYNEALRVIRTNLEFLQNTGKSKLITITSSVAGEGKTTTIIELGKIIAKSNKKVIILDMDMRRPTVYKQFNFSNNIGMSTLLAGKNTLEEVIQQAEDINLNTITSGPIPPNPSELIMSDILKEVIKELMQKYDYVLIDSPPIGMVADAMMIMHVSDLNLIILKANYSKKEFISKINRFVEDHDLNAGIILNGIAFDKTSGYGYGYGYGYGTKGGDDYYGSKQ